MAIGLVCPSKLAVIELKILGENLVKILQVVADRLVLKTGQIGQRVARFVLSKVKKCVFFFAHYSWTKTSGLVKISAYVLCGNFCHAKTRQKSATLPHTYNVLWSLVVLVFFFVIFSIKVVSATDSITTYHNVLPFFSSLIALSDFLTRSLLTKINPEDGYHLFNRSWLFRKSS